MNYILYILAIYFVFINIVGYFLMKVDKKRATKHQYRISEKTLWSIAFLFGSIGLTVGMNTFRHKTKHTNFKVGLPLLSLLEIGIIAYILFLLS
ncbi:DUF1294 domain-containing protein [Niallia sp. 01092]|uniref:DUF1294 domain-containing protein n=1 Tax=unclassified Niallia TaxID=2837522 RepID=UPI003FD4A5D3